ncbi:hypothetical protein [Athalassotoga saccharophila]|uniref:hypothetical protein n=1 Tax=Athalassotoga saccharophila TaxID=1441386 RepID=UPI00137A4017|nr:hypothetical protein [Athalassotoga saccharophila]
MPIIGTAESTISIGIKYFTVISGSWIRKSIAELCWADFVIGTAVATVVAEP